MRQLLLDLDPYPVDGIEYVLDAWGKNAKTLPALADLIGMLKTFLIPNLKERDYPGCHQCEEGWIVVNPEAKNSDWKMAPCPCLTDRSLRAKKNQTPITQQERVEFNSFLTNITGSPAKRFPNGNPRYNRAAVQAKALMYV